MWRLNRLQGIQIRSARRPRSMQNVMYNTYITSLGSKPNEGESRVWKPKTRPRSGLITQQTINYFTEMQRRSKKTGEAKAKMKGEREKDTFPSLLMHATLISLENERWLNFWPLRQIEYACDTFFGEKALKAHYVYAMCCISKRNTPTFLSLNLLACRTISLVQKLVRVSSALRFFSPSHFFRIFFSITSFALCAFVCVCVSASSICAVSAVGCSLVAFGISFSSACCV